MVRKLHARSKARESWKMLCFEEHFVAVEQIAQVSCKISLGEANLA
jgi:hypothetical protein